LLKNNLKENNIRKFYETLSNLAYLDKHSNEDYDLFHNIQCIENALTYIYEVERYRLFFFFFFPIYMNNPIQIDFRFIYIEFL